MVALTVELQILNTTARTIQTGVIVESITSSDLPLAILPDHVYVQANRLRSLIT